MSVPRIDRLHMAHADAQVLLHLLRLPPLHRAEMRKGSLFVRSCLIRTGGLDVYWWP